METDNLTSSILDKHAFDTILEDVIEPAILKYKEGIADQAVTLEVLYKAVLSMIDNT